MSRVRLELYVRSLAPRGDGPRQREIVDQLRTLADHGPVDHVDVVVWGEALPAETDHELGDRLDRLREWAATADATLVGVTDTETGSLVDPVRQVTTLPVLALAEYHDGDLVTVTPHEHDGAIRTVADHLGAIAQDTDAWLGSATAASD